METERRNRTPVLFQQGTLKMKRAICRKTLRGGYIKTVMFKKVKI